MIHIGYILWAQTLESHDKAENLVVNCLGTNEITITTLQ